MGRPQLAAGLIAFEPGLDLSPYTLYRCLAEGRPPLLVDVRPARGWWTFVGARPWPGPGWRPPPSREVVLFDDDGDSAREVARALLSEGFTRVHALWGGLELYDFALDPLIVGEERWLRRDRLDSEST